MTSIEMVQQKLDNVKETMSENIQFALKNTDKIEDIQQKSDLLMESSNTFTNKATSLKRNMCAKHWKFNVTVVLIVLIIIILIIIALK